MNDTKDNIIKSLKGLIDYIDHDDSKNADYWDTLEDVVSEWVSTYLNIGDHYES